MSKEPNLRLTERASSRVELSDQDINVLNEIVEYASVIPETTPWNALFKAYDAVLKARHIDPRQDDRCFRFLMRMAEVDRGTWTEKFQTLLERWGYVLTEPYSQHVLEEADHNENGDSSSSSGETAETDAEMADISSSTEDESNPNGRARSIPFKELDGSSLMLKRQERERELLSREEERKLQERLRAKREFAFPVDIIANASHGQSMIETEEQSNEASSTERMDHKEPIEIHVDAVEIAPLQNPQEHIRATANAAELYNIRVQHSLLQVLDTWRTRMERLAKYHEMQNQLAIAQDRRILLAQTLELWREKTYWTMVEAKVQKETENKTALQVLRKWRNKTTIIVERRQRVNDFILMHKCFNSWRSLTYENSRKVRQFQLYRAIRLLRHGCQRHQEQQNQAVVLYQHNLCYRAYWTWYYHYGASRATSYYENKLKSQASECLLNMLSNHIQNKHSATIFDTSRQYRFCFSYLSEKLAKIRKQEQEAEAFRRIKLLKVRFRFWRKAATLEPIADTVQDLVNDRILYDCLSLWCTRLRQNRAAAQVYRIRLLRSTFCSLDLEFRRRVFEATLTEKRKSQAMYMMVIQGRCNLLTRKRDSGCLGMAMHALRDTLRKRTAIMGVAESSAELQYAQNKQRSVLSTWLKRVTERQQHNQNADALYRVKLLQKCFQTLRSKLEHKRKLDLWAQSAYYFLTAKKVMSEWKEVFKTSQRAKRRSAFNIIMQKQRHKLKKTAFSALIIQQQLHKERQKQASDVYKKQLRAKVTDWLSTWRLQVQQITVSTSLAESFHVCQLLDGSLERVRKEFLRVRELQDVAEERSLQVRRDSAANLLRKWSIRSFSVKMDTMKANSFSERLQQNRRRHFLRTWMQQAMARRDAKAIDEQLHRQQELRDHAPSEVDEASTIEDTMSATSEGRSSHTFTKPSISTAQMFPKTPGGRAARARAFMHTDIIKPRLDRLHPMFVKNGINSTTPQGSPFISRQSSSSDVKGMVITERKLFSKSVNQVRDAKQTSYLPVMKDFRRMNIHDLARNNTSPNLHSSNDTDDLGGSTTIAYTSGS